MSFSVSSLPVASASVITTPFAFLTMGATTAPFFCGHHPLLVGVAFATLSFSPSFAAVTFVFRFFSVSSLTWAKTSSLGMVHTFYKAQLA
jgi:hypothetical protein